MSTQNERSIGEQLVRIIRSEIRAYDERKDDALRLRRIADEAVAKADQAAKAARESKPDPISAAIDAVCGIGDKSAQSLDALFERQGKPHVDFTTTDSTVPVDDLLRNQQQFAEKTAPWRPRGAPPATRGWWPRKKG
ncbi:MAG: hypothetical protein ACRDTI_10680 [Mycobacterium sp.]